MERKKIKETGLDLMPGWYKENQKSSKCIAYKRLWMRVAPLWYSIQIISRSSLWIAAF